MPKLEFAGQSARDQSNIAANPSRLVNCYREPVISSGRTSYTIKAAPGMSMIDTLNDPAQAMATVDGRLYAVAGKQFLRIRTTGATHLADIPFGDDSTISGNNGHVTITSGGFYRVWDGDAMVSPTAGAFSEYSGHDYIGNYTVLTEKNGRRFQWSALADPTDLPGLNFSTADGKDDNLIRPMAINGTLYLFKDRSHEVWYLTEGAGAEAFERQTGGVFDVGLRAYGLICWVPGGAFFVGNDGRAHVVSGGVNPVSTPAVETAIRDNQAVACFMYEAYGHTFCALTFSDRAAWVYDIATGEWHERAEGSDLAPWSAACAANFDGDWYVGRGNDVLRFSGSDSDGEVPLVREITSRTLEIGRGFFTVDLLEMFPRQGFNAQALELEVSRDGGLTWTAPKAAQIGPVGAYGRRVTWRGLGSSRQFTARIRASEAKDFTIDAECEVVVRK